MPQTTRIDDVYLCITEAALKDYGDLALRRSADGVLEGELYANTDGWTTETTIRLKLAPRGGFTAGFINCSESNQRNGSGNSATDSSQSM